MSLNASDLRPNAGATHAKKRLGRGNASGHGTTAGRGTKGQKARSGKKHPYDAHQGGQFPISRKFHVLRGFNNKWRIEYKPINLAALDRFDAGADVTPAVLKDAGLLKGSEFFVILGEGDLAKRLNVSAHRFSTSAREKIEAAGGVVTVLPVKAVQES
ncbi:MAG: 50S ribosomal protein L15 [Vicinamibacterales bacterium]